MPSPSPDTGIQSWFTDLKTMQADSVSAGLKQLPLLAFANANIATALPSTAQQNTFLAAVLADLGYPFSLADIPTYKTFRGLLDNAHLLENEIYNALKALSAPPLPAATDKAYYAALATTAFPGGSTGKSWAAPQTGVQAVLIASMDDTCFTPANQFKVNALVDKAGTAMGTVIQQIAVLG